MKATSSPRFLLRPILLLILVLPLSLAETPATTRAQDLDRCVITGDKTASPARVRLGEEVEIRLSLRPDCPPESFRTVDIVLAIDRSRSMAGSKLAAAKSAAKAFVDETDLSQQRIGVVSFDREGHIGTQLSDDADRIKSAIDAIPLGPGTNIAIAIDTAWDDVLAPNLRPGALPVIILIGDGDPNYPQGGDPAVAAVRSSNFARLGGAVIYAIGLGSDVKPELLKQVAGGETNYFFSPDESELEIIYRAIALQVGNFAVRDLVLDDDLSAEVDYVAGSGRPAPSEIQGKRLTWRAPLVPSSGIEFVYRVKPRRTGSFPTNDRAVARFVNADSGQEEFVFPQPRITVIDPPPEPAECSGTDWWTIMIHSFPDAVGKSGGAVPQGCNNAFDSGDWIDGTRYPLPELEYSLRSESGEVLWQGKGAPGPGRVDQRIYIRTCQPPPYTVELLTDGLRGYEICANLSTERQITRRDFHPLSFRRTEVRFGFQRGGVGFE